MPSASQETIDHWPHGQGKALELLDENFRERGGWYCRKDLSYEPTHKEWAALVYLVEEWDYAYLSGVTEIEDMTDSGRYDQLTDEDM